MRAGIFTGRENWESVEIKDVFLVHLESSDDPWAATLQIVLYFPSVHNTLIPQEDILTAGFIWEQVGLHMDIFYQLSCKNPAVIVNIYTNMTLVEKQYCLKSCIIEIQTEVII